MLLVDALSAPVLILHGQADTLARFSNLIQPVLLIVMGVVIAFLSLAATANDGLARDESTGDLLVGGAWNRKRCQANVSALAESTSMDCLLRMPTAQANELLRRLRWLRLGVRRRRQAAPSPRLRSRAGRHEHLARSEPVFHPVLPRWGGHARTADPPEQFG